MSPSNHASAATTVPRKQQDTNLSIGIQLCQKPSQPSTELALAKSANLPPLCAKPPRYVPIASNIALDLWPPVCDATQRPATVLRAAMPKTTVNEHSYLLCHKSKVRLAWQGFQLASKSIKAVSDKRRPHRPLHPAA